ncbi:Retrotransposon gag protein [Abeliophyllum distichum]|uniref:Retrotransposon gag protein n=1 Tax=Abeliophyllum distichum TaxID=126358 RepID=A0ABD1QU09_9LAMI
MLLEEDPFAPEIMAVPLPKGFKQPMIESYDGVTNPLDHLQTFVDMMRVVCSTRCIARGKGKPAIGLMQVIQQKEKTLQDYLARFSRATLGIKDLQMSAEVTAIMNGTQN